MLGSRTMLGRRSFLQQSALLGAGMLTGAAIPRFGWSQAARGEWPARIIMAGHSQPDTSFSTGLRVIEQRLADRFGHRFEIKQLFNIIELGYAGDDLHWLVDSNILTLAYSTPLSFGVPALNISSLPFVFDGNDEARAAMDGALGQAAIDFLEAHTGFRVLGFFENGFRHISNNVRPVRSPADVAGLKIRVLSVQEPAFRALGAETGFRQITDTIPLLADGTFDGQENPFENIVAYGAHPHQRYYTTTFHSYMSRPIFVNRTVFDAWPTALQDEMRAAVKAAVDEQRAQHDQAEIDAQVVIRDFGGEIIELTARQRAEFVAAVQPVYDDARSRYPRELLGLVGL